MAEAVRKGHDTPLVAIYLTVIIGGALSSVFSAGFMTAVPALVDKDRLHSANAKLQGALALAYVVGSLCAGIVAAAVGPIAAIAVDAGTFLLSAASLLVIRFRAVDRMQGGSQKAFGAGARFLLNHRMLRRMTMIRAGWHGRNHGQHRHRRNRAGGLGCRLSGPTGLSDICGSGPITCRCLRSPTDPPCCPLQDATNPRCCRATLQLLICVGCIVPDPGCY